MSLNVRKMAAADLSDIGATLLFNGGRYKVTAPHGVLEPQPDSSQMAIMAHNPSYRFVGFTQAGAGEPLQRQDPDRVPTLEEIRRSVKDAAVVRGKPIVPAGESELAKILAPRSAAPEKPAAEPHVPVGSDLPSLSEIRARHERAEKMHAEVTTPRIIDATTAQEVTETAAEVAVDPPSETPPPAVAAFPTKKEGGPVMGAFGDIEPVDVPKEDVFDPFAEDAEGDGADDGGESLESLGLPELRRIASRHGVRGYKGMTKEALVDAVRAAAGD